MPSLKKLFALGEFHISWNFGINMWKDSFEKFFGDLNYILVIYVNSAMFINDNFIL